MGSKIKVLMLSIVYPLAMSTYFKRAFQRRDDIDFVDCGPYTGSWIAWMGGMNVLDKYAIPPVVPLPFPPNIGQVDYGLVRALLNSMGRQEWKPDLVLTVDAGIHWNGKPPEGFVAHVATDPHCLDYDYQRRHSDKFFNMQAVYSQDGDIYLPYAYDPTVHYPENTGMDMDAVLIGMPYEQRINWVNALRQHGVSVIFENGPIFDEYRALAARASIGLNWSSLDDTNARAFEIPAMKLAPVMNRTTDMGRFLEDGVDYLGFPNVNEPKAINEAVDKVLYLKRNPDAALKMSESAYNKIKPHTYDERVFQILADCGF